MKAPPGAEVLAAERVATGHRSMESGEEDREAVHKGDEQARQLIKPTLESKFDRQKRRLPITNY